MPLARVVAHIAAAAGDGGAPAPVVAPMEAAAGGVGAGGGGAPAPVVADSAAGFH